MEEPKNVNFILFLFIFLRTIVLMQREITQKQHVRVGVGTLMHGKKTVWT